MSKYALERDFIRVDEIYRVCLREIKSSRFNADERISEYNSILKSLHKEIIVIHFNFAEFRGYRLFEQGKYENAIKYFNIAKSLVREVDFQDNKSQIDRFKKLIEECRKK